MKKFLALSLLALCAGHISDAQRQVHGFDKSGSNLRPIVQPAHKSTATVSGVLFPESFGTGSPCASSIYTYRDSTFGYYAGVNVYGDKELLMRYNLADFGVGLPATLDTVMAYFGAKYVGGNGNVRAKVYSANATGAPAALLATSGNKIVSSLDTTGGMTGFTFAAPVTLTSTRFFVAIDVSSLYATGDTVGLFSTDDACATTNATDAWAKQADDMFYAFSDPTNSYGFALDMAIFAHVHATTVGIGNTAMNAFAAQAYPVPATDVVHVSFTGQDNGIVQLALKDMTGRVVAHASRATAPGGNYKVPFALSELGSGLYFVELASGAQKSIIKVLVP